MMFITKNWKTVPHQ